LGAACNLWHLADSHRWTGGEPRRAPEYLRKKRRDSNDSHDAMDDANFLKDNTEKIELGKLKGNEGDQNYDLPAGADLNQYQAVVIYCERFHAIFGVAKLEKF
jgi:hypothetical protein